MPEPDTDEVGRRIRAARELAGLRSVEALAERIDQPRLGVRVLQGIERGQRRASRPELIVIAEALDVALEWFYVEDLGHAIDGSDAGLLDEMNAKLDRIIQTADAFDRTIGATAPDGETLLEILQRATAEQLQPPEDARTQESRKQPAEPPRRRQAARKTA